MLSRPQRAKKKHFVLRGRIQPHVDGVYAYQTSFGLQADKSSIVVKGPFFLKCEPKVSNLWNKRVMQDPI
jgi:hypothetical protein